MKKIYRRSLAFLISVITIVFLFIPANAYSSKDIDSGKDITLNISYQDGDMPLVGAKFNVYLVATLSEQGKLVPTELFSGYNVDIPKSNGEAWRVLASTLEGYVLRDNIASDNSGKTDNEGFLSFPVGERNLKPGLYLVLGQRHIQEGYRYDASPFMLMLPAEDMGSSELHYDVTANAKHVSIPFRNDTAERIITRKVLKVWDDKGNEAKRPKEIVVQLLKDGEIFDTVKLNAENNWQYAWDNLEDVYAWTVVEKEMDNYYVGVVREGITFVIKNTYKPSSSELIPTTPDGQATTTPDGQATTTPDGKTPTTPGGQTPTTPDGQTHTNPGEKTPHPGGQTPTTPGGKTPTTPGGKTPTPGGNTSKTPGGSSKLPQTGQLWWPVPVLLSMGLLFILIGLIRRRGYRNEK